jgi:solute carrier family 13 (sodium-dependent dicarboxylate transporter), member 2/3/5
MACSVPIMLLATFLTFVWLQCFYMGMFRPNSAAAKEGDIGKEGAKVALATIEHRYKELGRMSVQEKIVGFLFVFSIILLVTRKPGIFIGWAERITDSGNIQSASVFMFIVILIFIIPMNWDCFKFFKPNPGQLPTQSSPALLPWKYVQAKMPWGLIFLLGGGLALQAGGEASGL